MKRITSLLLAMVLFAGLVLTAAPTVRAASEMTASDALVEILKNEEGFSAKPYWDYGQYTVGYGTRCPDDMLEEYQTNGISEEDAELLLRNYLAGTEAVINTKLIDKYGLSLTQNQFDALITFTYNCGSAWVYDTDGVLHNAVKNGTSGSEMIRVFSLWCSAGGQILPGLVRRRLCEANMYLNGVYSNTKPSNYGFVYYNANGGSVDYRIQGYNADDGVAPAYTPVYSGHTFQGWYTDKTGGTKVTVLTADLSGDTLYARWDGTGEEEQTTTTPVEGVTIQVTATDVNLRKGPGTNYGIVGSANKGDTMVITETASGSGYEWGKAGDKWIALKFTNYADAVKEQDKTTEETEPEATEPTVPETTAPETTEPESTTITGTIKANGGLALREGPGTGYARIKYLPDGMKVTILEQQKAGSMTWGRISEGWISMSYVVVDQAETEPETEPETKPETTEPTTPEPTTPPTTEAEPEKLTGTVKADGGLALRKGPGFGYARIKYIANGTKVTILEQQSDGDTIWGRISEGWISLKYVVLDKAETQPETEPETKPETTEPTTPEPTTPPATESETTKLTGTVKADGGLALRKGPGFSYARIKYIADGTKVTILEQKTDGDTTWGRISEGWISMKYVVLDNAEAEPETTPEPTTPAEPEQNNTAVTGTVKADGGLAVRGGAGLNYAIKKYLPNGSQVTVTEQKDVNGTKWGYMGEGWICMDYVK